MFSFKPAWWLAIVPSLTAAAACAQPAAASSNTGAAAPPSATVSFQSALQGYQPFRDEPVRPWKDANDTVGKIGGWRAYAKEAAEPARASPEASESPKPSTGHGKH